MQKIILASNSQTRALLLQNAGISFEQKAADFDEESLDIQEPSKFVYHATKGKMNAFLHTNKLKELVLCADTVVTSRGELLRKAKDKEDARRILKAQSGSTVSIITCMILKSPHIEVIDLSSTDYLFDIFDEESLEKYLEGDEWQGKAGACMVEGFCKNYIKEVRGFESTAMGLCVEKLFTFFRREIMYEKELKAIHKSKRFRERKIYSEALHDFASNDYLGLAEKKQLLKRAYDRVSMFDSHAPKASQLVNGYHQIHKEFEDFLCRQNGFEAALVAGSGFLANLSLIEALPRKGDILILDEEYHASGVLASKLLHVEVIFFEHNRADKLEEILKTKKYHRAVIGVEGIYSMSGDILNKEIFDVTDRYKTVLIVDEAHSSGVIGKNLLGVFEVYNITPKANHIKMGTLGKAYGSYGAYILSSNHIREFLQNRAKALIYATAPSLIDIALAHQSMLYIFKHKTELASKVKERQELIKQMFDFDMQGLIFPCQMQDSQIVLDAQKTLEKEGFLVGAIRPPTVQNPILRVIPRVNIDLETTKQCFKKIKEMIL